ACGTPWVTRCQAAAPDGGEPDTVPAPACWVRAERLLRGRPHAPHLPHLPKVTTIDRRAEQDGRTWRVAAGEDLQRVLDQAALGDTIELEAGAEFTGNFILRHKPGQGWLVIRSADHASLPPPGVRVGPEHASHMARLISPNTRPVLRSELRAQRYFLRGLEITTSHDHTQSTAANLVLLGYGDGSYSATE